MGIGIGDLFLDLNLNTKKFDKQLNDTSSIANAKLGKVGKLIAGSLSTAAIASFAKSCVDLGSNLAEVQNVVDVTFPNMSKQVDEFSRKAIDQFGLSETVAKRMTGTFGSMSKAFGFSEKEAYDMSTTLTRLAGDVASFYNLDPTEAYTKLKSVFSGETESLKDLGVVMTQNALDQYALANGYGKTTSAMSEQEKVSLRLAFVTDQLSAASGDFSRTSDSWANKTRVLNLNFQSLKATLGQGLINVLSPILDVLNRIVLKLQEAAAWFTKFTSLLSNSKKTSTSMGSVSNAAKDVANNIGDIGNTAKKTAKQLNGLASFDELNVLSTASSNGDTSESSSSVLGLNEIGDLNEEIDTSAVDESFDKMKEKIDSFVGFFKEKGSLIISLCAGIVAGFIAFETIKNWGNIIGGISKIKSSLLGAFETFKTFIKFPNLVLQLFTGLSLSSVLVVAGIAAVTAALVYLYQENESFRNLVNESLESIMSILRNLWENILKPIFSFLLDMFNTIIVPIAEFLAKIFVKAVEAVFKIILSLWNNILAPIANFLVDVLGIALQGVIDIWEAWKPSIEALYDVLNWLWDDVLSPLVDFIVDEFMKCFEKWGDYIEELIPCVEEIFQGLTDFFVGVFSGDTEKCWDGIKKIFEGFSDFIENIFSTDWTELLGSLGKPLNEFLDVVKIIWNSIKGVFSGIIDFIKGVFTGNWKKAWEGVKKVFSSILGGLWEILKKPLNSIIDGINSFLRGLNKIKIPDWVPVVGGKSFNIPEIPKLANGGYVKANTPQLAIVGDNKRYGEIVSPENKMYEVMMNALKSYSANNSNREDIQVLVSILYEILEAIGNIRLVVDGDSLNDDKDKRDIERALRTGKVIV